MRNLKLLIEKHILKNFVMKTHSFIGTVSLIFIQIWLVRCGTQSRDWVDDSSFNKKLDDYNFEICGSEKHIYQYFNDRKGIKYIGGKYEIENEFRRRYSIKKMPNETGLIRIRFIVNCQGNTDRFRVFGMDNEYNERNFDPRIINKLLLITKSMTGWKVMTVEDHEVDYYQYLIFKIRDAQLIKILP